MKTFVIFDKSYRLRVIAKKILRKCWEKHPDCEQQLKAWYQETNKAQWNNTNVIKSEYPSASFLADNRVVFNIKGNHYRLIVSMQMEIEDFFIDFRSNNCV